MSEHPNTGGETTATSKQFNLDRAAPSARPTLAPIGPATPMRARGHVIFSCQGRRCVQHSHPDTERCAVPNLRPSERRQVALRLLGERLVNFESEHATRGSDDVGHEGRVVAQTAADVKDAMAGFELKRVD